MSDLRAELESRMRRPQRHRLLNGYPSTPVMSQTPRPMRFIDTADHDPTRPLIIGVLPHTFCNPTTPGCGFCTFPHERFTASAARATTAAVGREIREAVRLVPTLRSRAVPAVYVGGGTANLGRPEDIAGLFTGLGEAFDLRSAEVTLEGVPVYFTVRGSAMLDVLDRVHCRQRRISMGIQTFDPAWLKRMGRASFGDSAQVAALVQEAHRRRYTVSADLLFNLPGTGVDHAFRDIDTAIAMGFDQICVYHLVLSAGMPSAWARDPELVHAMPGNEQACSTWMRVREHLLRNGYQQQTLTNFERTEIAQDSRSFAYERLSFDALRTDGVGFGPGAISTVTFANGQAIKWTNVPTSVSYQDRMSGRNLLDSPVGSHFIYEEEDRQLLVLTRGISHGMVDGSAFTGAFGISVDQAYGDLLGAVVQAGLLQPGEEGGKWHLTPTGMFYADAVVGFLAHRRLSAMQEASRDLWSFHAHM